MLPAARTCNNYSAKLEPDIHKKINLGDMTRIDTVAAHGGMPKISTYSVSKAALNAMTKIHAYELRSARIRCSI